MSVFSARINWPGREGDSSSSVTEVKKEFSCTFTPTYAFMACRGTVLLFNILNCSCDLNSSWLEILSGKTGTAVGRSSLVFCTPLGLLNKIGCARGIIQAIKGELAATSRLHRVIILVSAIASCRLVYRRPTNPVA